MVAEVVEPLSMPAFTGVHRGNTLPSPATSVYEPAGSDMLKVPFASLCVEATSVVLFAFSTRICVEYPLRPQFADGGSVSTGHVGESVTKPFSVPSVPVGAASAFEVSVFMEDDDVACLPGSTQADGTSSLATTHCTNVGTHSF